MKALKEYIIESLYSINKHGEKHIIISEKDFNKLSKGKKVSTPYANKLIKSIDGDSAQYNIIPNGSIAKITELSDEHKKWYHAKQYNYIKNCKVYQISVSGPSLSDIIYFPSFEILNEKQWKFEYNANPNDNELGMLATSGNEGTGTHSFTDKNIKEVEKRLKNVGFKIIYK